MGLPPPTRPHPVIYDPENYYLPAPKPAGIIFAIIQFVSLIFNYIKQYKKLLFLTLFLGAVNQIFSLLDPQIFRLIIDNYANKFSELSSSDFFRGVIILLLASVGVHFISRVAKNFQDYFVSAIKEKVGAKMYQDSVSHSFSLSYATFEDQRSGELLKKLDKARTDTQILIQSSINILFVSLVGILFILIYAFFVHWSVGLAFFLIVPIMAWATYLISRKIKTAQEEIFKETADLAGSTTETLRNVELVKSLGLEQQETSRLNKVTDKILALELKKVTLIRKMSFTQGTMVNLMRSGILLLMLFLIYQQSITLGEFFSILFYSFFIFNPLSEFGNIASQFQEAKAANESLMEILNIEPEPLPENPKSIGIIKNIKFKNLSFSYNGSNTPSAKNIDLEIKSDQTIAFVGPSGSGKSTLVKLLVGLYKPSKGDLKINNISILNINPYELRSKISYVAQETQLFAGTIKENLLFVNPKATEEECLAALRSASAKPIIERGNKGLNTKIGEGGIKISGGERQRLAIARALLRNPQVLIFDEATSSLDSITEKSITETIKKISTEEKDLITILVAHRLSTIIHADIIYVLEKGKIIEQGNHKELVKSKGLYSALWREQNPDSN